MVLLDMEMPKSCKDCRINTDGNGRCGALNSSCMYFAGHETKPVYCPIKAEISKNATNGDVKKAMFLNTEFLINESLGEKGTVFFESDENVILYSLDWWNAPYRRKE